MTGWAATQAVVDTPHRVRKEHETEETSGCGHTYDHKVMFRFWDRRLAIRSAAPLRLAPGRRWVVPPTAGQPTQEIRDFAVELVAALSDAAELDTDACVQEVIVAWRATARIKGDPRQYTNALPPTKGDFGPVEVTA
jgi:hypothetical protein